VSEHTTAPTAPTNPSATKPESRGQRKHRMWKYDRATHVRAVERDISRVNFTQAPSVESPNLFTLSATLKAFPALASTCPHSDEDEEDGQTITLPRNYAATVYALVNSPAVNAGLITYGD
jgi:hypothetical protein